MLMPVNVRRMVLGNVQLHPVSRRFLLPLVLVCNSLMNYAPAVNLILGQQNSQTYRWKSCVRLTECHYKYPVDVMLYKVKHKTVS